MVVLGTSPGARWHDQRVHNDTMHFCDRMSVSSSYVLALQYVGMVLCLPGTLLVDNALDLLTRSEVGACRWQDEMDPADMLARAHYRYINAITVHDPAPIGPSQTLAVKVRAYLLVASTLCTCVCCTAAVT